MVNQRVYRYDSVSRFLEMEAGNLEPCECEGLNYCVGCSLELDLGFITVPDHTECLDCEGTGWVVVTSSTEQMPAHRLEDSGGDLSTL